VADIKSIRARKREYETHPKECGCKIGQCEERRRLLARYMREAEIWAEYRVAVSTAGYL
jgi:hypothetical protein